MALHIEPAFSIPLGFAKMEDCQAFNDELKALFLARSQQPEYANPDVYTHRNPALFESHFRLFEWPQPVIQKLRTFCMQNLYAMIRDLNGYDTATLSRLHSAEQAWFHVTHKGGYFGPHNHPLHSWSGVYCVSHTGDNPQSDSGKLTFINPNYAGSMFIDMATAKMQRPYSMSNIMLRLNAGDLVLFPSWLLHEVLPYEGDDVRITVAFNVCFRMMGVSPHDGPVG